MFCNNLFYLNVIVRPRSAVRNVSSNRCQSDCRSRGREFDASPVPYFRGDWSWNNFYSHSPPFRSIIQEGLLSVTSESMCTKYWLTACSSLPRKSVVRWTDRPAMTIAVDLGRKATHFPSCSIAFHAAFYLRKARCFILCLSSYSNCISCWAIPSCNFTFHAILYLRVTLRFVPSFCFLFCLAFM